MKNFRKNVLKSRNGITLIALVITIIVLLILAGISISMLAGDNSILNKTEEARDITGTRDIEERIKLAYMAAISTGFGDTTKGAFEDELKKEFGKDNVKDLADDLSKVKINGKEYETGVSGGGGETTAKIKDKKPTSGGTVTALSDKDTTQLEDDLGNIVKVPKGFGIATDSGTKVEEGIVIEDADSSRDTYKSQFVWVPVGMEIKVSTEISVTGEIDIPLGRYVFNRSTGVVDENLSKTEPLDQLRISASSSYYYTEKINDGTTTNSYARDIVGFINSANINKGYYIARYEAGMSGTTSSTTESTLSDGNTSKNSDLAAQVVTKSGVGVWNYISRGNASAVCRSMYNANSDKVTSDLINSYAWDTAIVFIEKCGTNNNYANKTDGNGILKTTGNNSDEQCKINDMAGNVYEWSTEAYSGISGPFVYRGGVYASNLYTAYRGTELTTTTSSSYGFRPLLYL